MHKIYFLLILLFSIESIFAFAICGYPDKNGECTGKVTATKDDIGNVPDSCCRIFMYENDYDYGTKYTDYEEEEYCLQIKKSKAADYVGYILDHTSMIISPDQLTITCDSEVVYDSNLSSSYIKILNLLGLFIFLLF